MQKQTKLKYLHRYILEDAVSARDFVSSCVICYFYCRFLVFAVIFRLTDVGVYKAMVETWGPDFVYRTRFSGGSAGTVFAVGLCLGKSPEYMNNLYLRIANETHANMNALTPVWEASLITKRAVAEMLLEEPHSVSKLKDRCLLGTTAFFCKHRWISDWHNHDDLMTHIKASYHIPFHCERGPILDGVEVVDGAYGFSGYDLPDGDETLYVGIDPHAEITRSFTQAEMFYPSIGSDYEEMVKSGYEAFLAWDGRKIKKVGQRRPNYEILAVLWILKLLEVPYFLLKDFIFWFVHCILAVLKACGIVRTKHIIHTDFEY
jgi:hypothetical protein